MAKDWEPLHADIRELYHVNNKPLAEVMRLVKGRHGFVASERSYRTQLQKWGYSKYSTQKSPRPFGKKPASVRRVQAFPSSTASANNPSSLPGLSTAASAFVRGGEDMLQHYNIPTNIMMQPVNAHYTDFNNMTFDLVHPAKDHNGKTPLHHAVINKNIEQVRILLHAGDAVNVKDYAANDPLHYAVMAAEAPIVNLLVRFGADINAKGQLNRSPLHMAVAFPSSPIVDALINAGAAVSSQDDKGDTPLHLAFAHPSCTEQVQGLIKALLQARADVNTANVAGLTPFHKALQLYSSSLDSNTGFPLSNILTFLQHGSSAIKPFPDGVLPLTVYLAKNPKDWSTKSSSWAFFDKLHRNIMIQFLDAGASPTTPMSSGEPLANYYFRELHNARKADRTWAARLCTSADPSHTNSNGNTLLHEVLMQVDASLDECIDQLLRYGANPNCQNHAGQTPMHVLFTSPRCIPKEVRYIENAITKLLAAGANPWIRDNMGTCSCYEAIRKVWKVNPIIPRLLLKAELRYKPHHEPNSESGAARTRSQDWEEWDQAIRAEHWFEARELIFRHTNSLPADVEKELKVSAYAVLTEKFLEGARAKFTKDERQDRRGYIANILRDCRARKISLDMQYYDDLLEVC